MFCWTMFCWTMFCWTMFCWTMFRGNFHKIKFFENHHMREVGRSFFSKKKDRMILLEWFFSNDSSCFFLKFRGKWTPQIHPINQAFHGARPAWALWSPDGERIDIFFIKKTMKKKHEWSLQDILSQLMVTPPESLHHTIISSWCTRTPNHLWSVDPFRRLVGTMEGSESLSSESEEESSSWERILLQTLLSSFTTSIWVKFSRKSLTTSKIKQKDFTSSGLHSFVFEDEANTRWSEPLNIILISSTITSPRSEPLEVNKQTISWTLTSTSPTRVWQDLMSWFSRQKKNHEWSLQDILSEAHDHSTFTNSSSSSFWSLRRSISLRDALQTFKMFSRKTFRIHEIIDKWSIVSQCFTQKVLHHTHLCVFSYDQEVFQFWKTAQFLAGREASKWVFAPNEESQRFSSKWRIATEFFQNVLSFKMFWVSKCFKFQNVLSFKMFLVPTGFHFTMCWLWVYWRDDLSRCWEFFLKKVSRLYAFSGSPDLTWLLSIAKNFWQKNVKKPNNSWYTRG